MPKAQCINDNTLFSVKEAEMINWAKYQADYQMIMSTGTLAVFKKANISNVNAIPKGKRYRYFRIENKLYEVNFIR